VNPELARPLRSRSIRSLSLRYGAAIVVVGVTASMRALLNPVLHDRAAVLPFTVAVMVAAWYGGFGPGLLATAVSVLVADYFWMIPTGSLWLASGADRLVLALFVGIGVAISTLNAAVHHARKRAEQRSAELLEREEAHRRILETASEGIWTLDTSGVVTFANRGMAEMLGIDPRALPGRSFFDFVPAEDRDLASERYRAVLAGERAAFEARFVRVDGSLIWAHVSATAIPDGGGSPVGMLGMFTDVTARHRAEAELQRLLASEQRSRAEAEAANRAKDEFLATVSHELRTPLNAMLGWLTMLRSGALEPAKTERALEVIERNARSQAKLIEDLLDVSRMISGNLRLERKRIAAGTIVDGAIDVVAPMAAEKKVEIVRRIAKANDLVAADPERLKQIVVNLATNAVKFTPQGGRVTIQVARRGGSIVIEVADTGQGMAREFLPHAFDRFRQQDASMTRKHAGLGLGLAIVRHLVELHGGTVTADSDGPGKGARFLVSLPVLDDVSASTLPRAVPALSEPPDIRAPSTTLRGARVLVVDDETDSLEMLSELLTRAGAEARTASCAKDALPIVTEWHPDLIVSDLAMPEEDGYDLLGRVRALGTELGGRTPAIALTAHARLTDRLRVLSSGFQAYLSKPVEPLELIATARRVLVPRATTSAHA
jgi:PAS domain S-box-containing protein